MFISQLSTQREQPDEPVTTQAAAQLRVLDQLRQSAQQTLLTALRNPVMQNSPPSPLSSRSLLDVAWNVSTRPGAQPTDVRNDVAAEYQRLHPSLNREQATFLADAFLQSIREANPQPFAPTYVAPSSIMIQRAIETVQIRTQTTDVSAAAGTAQTVNNTAEFQAAPAAARQWVATRAQELAETTANVANSHFTSVSSLSDHGVDEQAERDLQARIRRLNPVLTDQLALVAAHMFLETHLMNGRTATQDGTVEAYQRGNREEAHAYLEVGRATCRAGQNLGMREVGNEQTYLTQLAQRPGMNQEMISDMLSAAVGIGFAAAAIFGAAQDSSLPPEFRQQIQNEVMQRSRDLFNNIRDTIERLNQESNPVRRQEYERELARYEHELEGTVRWNPVREAEKLMREGRADEAWQVIQDHTELIRRIHSGELGGIRLSRAPETESIRGV